MIRIHSKFNNTQIVMRMRSTRFRVHMTKLLRLDEEFEGVSLDNTAYRMNPDGSDSEEVVPEE